MCTLDWRCFDDSEKKRIDNGIKAKRGKEGGECEVIEIFIGKHSFLSCARSSSCAGELSQIREIMWHEAWSECRQFTSVFHPVRMVGGVYKDVYIHNRSVARLLFGFLASVCVTLI